jgi:hypothetical protein
MNVSEEYNAPIFTVEESARQTSSKAQAAGRAYLFVIRSLGLSSDPEHLYTVLFVIHIGRREREKERSEEEYH